MIKDCINAFKDILHWRQYIRHIVKGENEKQVKKQVKDIAYTLKVQNRINELTNSALNSTSRGISNDEICSEDVIVSLTSYGPRYCECYLAIESIMQGTVKPNRIILWVPDTIEKEPIPVLLQNQMKRGLEIRFVKDIRSYTKYIYALKEFPKAAIITVDDDILYTHDTVENLINTHNSMNGIICANMIYPLPIDLAKDYKFFAAFGYLHNYKETADRYIVQGFAGILYPPNIFSNEIFDESVFLDICKYADDVWFSAMGMKHNVKAVCCNTHLGEFEYIRNEKVQSIGLKHINDEGEVMNNKQIHDVFTKYHLCGF